MSDKIPKKIMDILKAAPCKEEPDLPFKMPFNMDAMYIDLGPGANRKIVKDNKRL